MKKYRWEAQSNDGSYYDDSNKLFDTKRECYEDMRNAVLSKMTWNTQFDEDFADLQDDEFIGYKVRFNPNQITHESYSGLYTYDIVEVEDVMKTFEFTQEQIAMIIDALCYKQVMWKDHNKVIQMHGTNEMIEGFVKSNNEKIVCLQTLIDYLKLNE